MKCNQCDSCYINDTFCHELGCPNIGKRYDKESGTWISQYECSICGYMHDTETGCQYEEDENGN